MSVNTMAINNTIYVLQRNFGTKTIPDLIADTVADIGTVKNDLTETPTTSYNSGESVEEAVDD